MIRIDTALTPRALLPHVRRTFEISADKISRLHKSWDPRKGSPVFTVRGSYASRGWTEWTQGFFFGLPILQFDGTGERRFLELGRRGTADHMGEHITHMGVHDHGFNVVSTYGNLHRLMHEGRIGDDPWQRRCYELALKASGAVQAARWTDLGEGRGFIYSFNGPHSLFADTMRTLRSLAVAHRLGGVLRGEKDRRISLLERLLRHGEATAQYAVYYGRGRDRYDVRGRVAHESIFNVTDGSYRCPNSQQGYSPFTTWTRGLAWVLTGFAEELEFLAVQAEAEKGSVRWMEPDMRLFLRAARAVADFYIGNTPADGIPYWDTGAPGLERLGDYLGRPADPFNDEEPVDSSAAAIAAQGLIRLGRFLQQTDRQAAGERYFQAGLTVARTVLSEPYLAAPGPHQGLLLHSVYHRPNGWDYVPRGRKIPCGESCMWGDYHTLELALLLQRLAARKRYYAFFV